MKYVSFAEIWFVKTSTRIVKYQSRVVKLNLVNFSFIDIQMLFECPVVYK